MEEELEFLEYLHNIVKLEKDATERIIKFRNKVDLLNDVLKEQIIMYKKFSISLTRMIENRKKKVDDLSLLTKMMAHISVKIVVANISDEKLIFDHLIKRYNICIEEVKSRLEEKNIKSKTILNLSYRFIEFENKNVEILNKTYRYLKNKT